MVELRVIRVQGQLLKQLVRYVLMPSGNAEFYGATGILEFNPGEREVLVALVARPDGVPEVQLHDCPSPLYDIMYVWLGHSLLTVRVSPVLLFPVSNAFEVQNQFAGFDSCTCVRL